MMSNHPNKETVQLIKLCNEDSGVKGISKSAWHEEQASFHGTNIHEY